MAAKPEAAPPENSQALVPYEPNKDEPPKKSAMEIAAEKTAAYGKERARRERLKLEERLKKELFDR